VDGNEGFSVDVGCREMLEFSYGEVRERPIRHAWRACVPQGTVGSNPTLSVFPGAGAGRARCDVRTLDRAVVDATAEGMVVRSDS
jgi:hypothetical protein